MTFPNLKKTMNPTITNFGYPQTLIKEYAHWVVLLRPKQVTLGSLILACKADAVAWSEISPQAFAELEKVTNELESTLRAAFQYDKLNYLMLMMVDPNVHFHVIPRYSSVRSFEGVEFKDSKWPGPPDLGVSVETNPDTNARIKEQLVLAWSTNS